MLLLLAHHTPVCFYDQQDSQSYPKERQLNAKASGSERVILFSFFFNKNSRLVCVLTLVLAQNYLLISVHTHMHTCTYAHYSFYLRLSLLIVAVFHCAYTCTYAHYSFYLRLSPLLLSSTVHTHAHMHTIAST